MQQKGFQVYVNRSLRIGHCGSLVAHHLNGLTEGNVTLFYAILYRHISRYTALSLLNIGSVDDFSLSFLLCWITVFIISEI